MAFEDGLMMVRHTTAIATAARAANLPAAKVAIPPFPLEVKRSVIPLAANLMMPAFDRAVERHYAAIAQSRITAVTLAILTIAGLLPAENYTLRAKLAGEKPHKVELDEKVDLRRRGVEKFKALPRDQTEG